jgi:hypothetical protein
MEMRYAFIFTTDFNEGSFRKAAGLHKDQFYVGTRDVHVT